VSDQVETHTTEVVWQRLQSDGDIPDRQSFGHDPGANDRRRQQHRAQPFGEECAIHRSGRLVVGLSAPNGAELLLQCHSIQGFDREVHEELDAGLEFGERLSKPERVNDFETPESKSLTDREG
jgi:hypothetical protein